MTDTDCPVLQPQFFVPVFLVLVHVGQRKWCGSQVSSCIFSFFASLDILPCHSFSFFFLTDWPLPGSSSCNVLPLALSSFRTFISASLKRFIRWRVWISTRRLYPFCHQLSGAKEKKTLPFLTEMPFNYLNQMGCTLTKTFPFVSFLGWCSAHVEGFQQLINYPIIPE